MLGVGVHEWFCLFVCVCVCVCILRLLNSMARLFTKFSSSDEVMSLAFQVLPLYESSLPSSAPPIMTQLQMCAMEAFSTYDYQGHPSTVDQALKFVILLWKKYPGSLPPASNTKHLAYLVRAALQPELNGHSRSREAIANGSDFVADIMRHLSDSQVDALHRESISNSLRHLMIFYEKMSLEELKVILVGVGMFAELNHSAMDFIEDNSYVGFIQVILQYPSEPSIQTLAWNLFSVLCNTSSKFASALLEAGILRTVVSLLQSENIVALPAVTFLARYRYNIRELAVTNKELLTCLVKLLQEECPKIKEKDSELAGKICEFLSKLCACGPSGLNALFELDVVRHILDCARARPNDLYILLACMALEGLSNSIPPSIIPLQIKDVATTVRSEFSNQNYQEFVKDMLGDPLVISNPKLLKTLYLTFQKVLRPLSQEDLKEKVHTRDFMDFYFKCFVRDTTAFQSLVVRATFTTHYFIFEMKKKEPVVILKDIEFHGIVANLLKESKSPDAVSTVMGLLACLVCKYYDHLKSVKPFVEAKVPYILLEKAKLLGNNTQFSDDFGRVILNMTADKELSLDLYKDGYLEKLLEVFGDKAMLGVRKSITHAVGNIALGGQHIKQVILDKEFYRSLFAILQNEMKTAEPFLISACCRVLHILASGDWVKRKLVESGCIDLLLKLMRDRQDNAEIQVRPLGLLSSLGFMSVVNRRFILTDEILEVVASILRKSTSGKVISYTTLVFLGSDELDFGAIKLRQLGVVEVLQTAMDNAAYCKQAPDLERWGVHVLEKQNLYTLCLPKDCPVSVPASLPEHRASYWPPYLTKETNVDSPIPSDGSILLPLKEVYFKPNSPIAPELNSSDRSQLISLGLDPDKPLFRIGRLYGSTHGLCSNCDRESRSEELVIRPLSMTADQYQQLVDSGWYRRGGVKMFRLRHNHNVECCDWETRVLVKHFDHTKHKSYKKVLRRMPMERLTVETCHAHFSREAFDLYNEYHIKKHDKPLKSEFSYCEHVVNTPTTYQVIDGVEYGTFHQMYRLDGKLVAVGIIDVIPRGMVSIYMWYDVNKEMAKYSFGVYSALKEIEMVKSMREKNPSMEYYYLQGWNSNNKKLSYKANYEPEEFYCPCIVTDWVSALDGVEKSKKEMLETCTEKEGTDGEGTKSTEDPRSTEEPKSTQNATPTNANSNENDLTKDSSKPQQAEAFPLDKSRCRNVEGHDLDIRKIVICLNYVKFMYLEDFFRDCVTNKDQKEILETRFRELYVALSPDLRSHLVIDIMVSQNLEN